MYPPWSTPEAPPCGPGGIPLTWNCLRLPRTDQTLSPLFLPLVWRRIYKNHWGRVSALPEGKEGTHMARTQVRVGGSGFGMGTFLI